MRVMRPVTCLLVCLPAQRQKNLKGCPLSQPAADANSTTMCLDNLLRDGKSQSCSMFPAAFSGGVGLIKTVEDVRLHLVGNPRACVRNEDQDPIIYSRSPQRNLPSAGRELKGVIHQVSENLGEAVTIRGYYPGR